MPLNELEETCIEQFRSGAGSPTREKGDTADWIGLGFEVLLTAGRMLRANRYVTTRDTPGENWPKRSARMRPRLRSGPGRTCQSTSGRSMTTR